MTGALHAACGCCISTANIAKRLSMIAYLLEQGADKDGYHDGYTPLYHAIQSSHVEVDTLVIIKYLILQEVDKHKLCQYFGSTLVRAAISRCGHQPSLPILKFLHEQGLDLNKVCNNGKTPLQHALKYMDEEYLLDVVRFFIEHGAIINQDDDSALTIACSKHYLSICKLLVEHGADVNQVFTCDAVLYVTNRNPNRDPFRDPKRNINLTLPVMQQTLHLG